MACCMAKEDMKGQWRTVVHTRFCSQLHGIVPMPLRLLSQNGMAQSGFLTVVP